MVRRFAQVSLAIFLVLAVATLASAAPNVANTTQKGALLVFPKVECYSAVPNDGCSEVNTYFFLNNDYVLGTYVKCYWMDNNQSVEDFHFYLTANQPIVFSAGTNPYGPPFGDNRVGSLVCWAQDEWDAKPAGLPPTNPTQGFNHLYGYAMLSVTGGVNVFYNAYSFYLANFANAVDKMQDGFGGWQLNLNAVAYDACPQYLITSFLPAVDVQTGGGVNSFIGGNPDLTLWPCKQDLRQDRTPTCTKAKFDIWDYNEYKYTGSYQCFKCFFEGFLHKVGDKAGFYGPDGKWVYKRGPGFGGEKFLWDTLGYNPNGLPDQYATPARLRITGVKSDKICTPNATTTGTKYDGIWCAANSTVNSGLLGVLLYADRHAGWVATADGTAPGVDAVSGHTLHGAGKATTDTTGGPGWIRYDGTDQSVPESAQR